MEMQKLKSISALWNAYDSAVWVRAFGTALTSLTGFMMRPFLVLYLNSRLEGSVMLTMFVVMLQPLFGMLVNMFSGGLSDRLGRKPIMLASLFIQAFSLAGYMFASEVWHFALLSIVGGMGGAMFMPAANAQVSDVVPEEKRAEVFALFHTALNLGAAIGPLIGLGLFSWNPNIIFLISALSTLVYALVVWWKVPETLKVKQSSRKNAGTQSAERIRLWDHKLLYWITLLAIPVNLLYAQVETTFPLHLQTRFADFKTVYATLVTFNGVVVILLQMWMARATQDFSAHRVVALTYTLFALVAFGYGFIPWYFLLFVVEFIFTIAEMMFGPHMQKVISVIAPEKHRGFYFSVYGMNWQIGRALGPLIGGWMFTLINGEFMFGMIGGIILLSGFILFTIARKLYSGRNEFAAAPSSEAAANTTTA